MPPFVYAAPGGLYVRLDGELLRKIREDRNISLGMLAEIAGVSRKAIQMYESGMGAMVEIAAKLEEFLNEPIVVPLNPFAYTLEVAKTLRPSTISKVSTGMSSRCSERSGIPSRRP